MSGSEAPTREQRCDRRPHTRPKLLLHGMPSRSSCTASHVAVVVPQGVHNLGFIPVVLYKGICGTLGTVSAPLVSVALALSTHPTVPIPRVPVPVAACRGDHKTRAIVHVMRPLLHAIVIVWVAYQCPCHTNRARNQGVQTIPGWEHHLA